MSKKTVHLVCNAHLDPVWLWEWQEGAAEAMSTFRTAADLIEEFDGFVFNHNEALLYKWIEEYEPSLFRRIQKLVKEGRWHIMGGWWVQPDCNMPSGESVARQILAGQEFFSEKFGARPTTAINFDPFGHSRGLVQILRKAGYDSYLVCRPGPGDCPVPADLFRWVGYDGSEVRCHIAPMFYGSGLGRAHEKLAGHLKDHGSQDLTLLLWGVGNHGGGPSRLDLTNLARDMAASETHKISHSTPEAFFSAVHSSGKELPIVDKALNPWAVGCYTSQIRIKQKHRALENELFMVEKMCSAATMQSLLEYPSDDLHRAQEALLTCEFHDVLPGSSIQPAEEASIRMLDYGLEIAGRLKARAFFALSSGQKKADTGTYPVLVYNPHPYEIEQTVECEFQLADQWWQDSFTDITVTEAGADVPSQVEKELSNLTLDWRKRVVFRAKLKPGQMNRFDCHAHPETPRVKPTLPVENGCLQFKGKRVQASINMSTGLLDRYVVDGVDVVGQGAWQPLAIKDNEDSWGMTVHSFREVAGKFGLLSPEKSGEISGVRSGTLPPVRVVDQGAVRTVVEACFGFNDSFVILTYKLPNAGTELEVGVRAIWNEKNRMLKLAVPTPDPKSRYLGQVMYGVEELRTNGDECVAQKWVAAVSDKDDRAVTIVNDSIYGSDFKDGEIRLTLLRSPAFSGHPINDRPIVPQDRFTARIDQGERLYSFWLNAGTAAERLNAVDREALTKNEKPFALSFFPAGHGKTLQPAVQLTGEAVVMTAMKKAEANNDVIVRVFNPTPAESKAALRLPALDVHTDLTFKPFELKTLRISTKTKRAREVNLLEVAESTTKPKSRAKSLSLL